MIGLAHLGLTGAEGLEELPERITVVAGVVDAVDADVEPVDRIRQRIDRVLERVPAERLILAPDAGLRGVAIAVAEKKIANLAEAATLTA